MAHQAVPISSQGSEDPGEQVVNKELSEDISDGYKIVILFSRYSLPDDHPLFDRFGDLEVCITADQNRLSMIETYDSREEALIRMNSRYSSAFPNACVVGFRNGVTVD